MADMITPVRLRGGEIIGVYAPAETICDMLEGAPFRFVRLSVAGSEGPQFISLRASEVVLIGESFQSEDGHPFRRKSPIAQ